jgi:hypothetical protein
MEADPALEFSYFLAQQLGRTVAEVGEMSNEEFVGWSVYYARKAQREELERKRAKGG